MSGRLGSPVRPGVEGALRPAHAGIAWLLDLPRLRPQVFLAPTDGGGAVRPMRILMIEDDADLAQMYALRLRREGHAVEIVSDGKVGLERASGGGYDVILLDVNLPMLDGISVLQRLRRTPGGAELPVLVLSNYSDVRLVENARALGVRRYLVKSETAPSDVVRLVREIQASR